jgi:hypothetical protein
MSASDSDSAAPPTTSRSKKQVKSAAEVIDSDEEAGGDDDELYPLEGIYKDAADRRAYVTGSPFRLATLASETHLEPFGQS